MRDPTDERLSHDLDELLAAGPVSAPDRLLTAAGARRRARRATRAWQGSALLLALAAAGLVWLAPVASPAPAGDPDAPDVLFAGLPDYQPPPSSARTAILRPLDLDQALQWAAGNGS